MERHKRGPLMESIRNKYDTEKVVLSNHDDPRDRNVEVYTDDELPHEFFRWVTDKRGSSVQRVRKLHASDVPNWKYVIGDRDV